LQPRWFGDALHSPQYREVPHLQQAHETIESNDSNFKITSQLFQGFYYPIIFEIPMNNGKNHHPTWQFGNGTAMLFIKLWGSFGGSFETELMYGKSHKKKCLPTNQESVNSFGQK